MGLFNLRVPSTTSIVVFNILQSVKLNIGLSGFFFKRMSHVLSVLNSK